MNDLIYKNITIKLWQQLLMQYTKVKRVDEQIIPHHEYTIPR